MLEAGFFQFITKRLNLPLWLCDPPTSPFLYWQLATPVFVVFINVPIRWLGVREPTALRGRHDVQALYFL
jgi:hypothetical protein